MGAMAAGAASAPSTTAGSRSKSQAQLRQSPELLGVCVVYLGGLNYFFAVDERCPIVSRIGTVIGYAHVTIAPFVAPPWANGTRDSGAFAPYERAHIDEPEEQVYDYIDRTLEYRMTISHISEIDSRNFSRVTLRYGFYREPSRHTEAFAISNRMAEIQASTRHIVDVTDALVKFLTGNTLMIEVYGSE